MVLPVPSSLSAIKMIYVILGIFLSILGKILCIGQEFWVSLHREY